MKLWQAGLTSTLLVVGTATLSSVATRRGIGGGWYDRIKPKFAPPNVVFPIVWTILYVLTAIGFTHTLYKPQYYAATLILMYLVFSIAWCFTFFAWGKIQDAFYIIAVLWILIASLIAMTRAQIIMMVCFLPLLTWLTFAMFLNVQVVWNSHKITPQPEPEPFVAATSSSIVSSSSTCHYHADA